MKKINNFKLVFLAYISIIFFLPDYVYADSKIKLSKEAFERIKQYISGNINSYTFNNKIYNVTSLVFFLSKDGQFSTFAYCRRSGIDANTCLTNSPYIFQTKYRCEKLSKQTCIAIFEKNVLINSNERLINLNHPERYFEINLNLSNNPKNHSDFEVINSKDFEGDSNYQ